MTGRAPDPRSSWSAAPSATRRFPKTVQLAELLADRFTVFNYDRRGRGDSGDGARYAVEREVEDLAAVVGAAGGRASVWG